MTMITTRDRPALDLAPWAAHILAAAACIFTVLIVGLSFIDLIPWQWTEPERTAGLAAAFGVPALLAWLFYRLLTRPG